jgi:hypothetical protein
MSFKTLIMAGTLALGFAMLPVPSNAQGPLYDKVMVNLPYTLTVGDHVLQPGDYVIRQLPGQGGASRVLLIYSDNGMKFETSALTIPTLDNRTPEDTKVVLHHFGNDYYFDKIWVQGKNYGYEFPLPDSVKARERERMAPMSVAARYEAVPAENTTQTAQNTQTETNTETHTTMAEPTPAPAPTTTPVQEEQPAQTAQNTPPPSPAPTPTENNANREETTTHTMPATAANWLMMLLGGGALSGVGLALRRKR